MVWLRDDGFIESRVRTLTIVVVVVVEIVDRSVGIISSIWFWGRGERDKYVPRLERKRSRKTNLEVKF